jgi:hypothetical protein
LSEFLRWLTVTHTQRYHAHYHTSGTGPLYQGRFKSFPIEQDDHLLTVTRYAERKRSPGGVGPATRDRSRYQRVGLHTSTNQRPRRNWKQCGRP